MTATKKAPNQIIRLALILFVVSAITSGVLGLVNYFTKDIIAEREREKTAAAYQAVLPYDGEYETVAFDEDAWETVNAISRAGDEGWVVELTFSGAQSSITAAFGVSAADYSITGASVIDHAETSGLGAKITEPEFTDSFIGQDRGHGGDQGRRHGGLHHRRHHILSRHGQRGQHGHRRREGARLKGGLGVNLKQQFKEGLITNNPVLVQRIGMCSTMAITTSLFNGIGMGLSVLIILTCCNVAISALRKAIPNDIRLAIFVVVIAGFVTIVDLLLQAFIPALSASLGVFIPLIVVNCIIIGRAEAFCQHEPIGPSFFDGIFQGFGYTVVLVLMCLIRELLGSGTFGTGIFEIVDGALRVSFDGSAAGIRIFPEQFGATILIMPFGGFLTLASLLAAMQYALRKSAEKKEAAERAAKVEVVKEAANNA